MSFILNDIKKNSLAIVKGGKNKNKHLHFINKSLSLYDLDKKYIDNLNDNEKTILNKSIKEKLQPEDLKLEDKFYNLMNEINMKKKKIIF